MKQSINYKMIKNKKIFSNTIWILLPFVSYFTCNKFLLDCKIHLKYIVIKKKIMILRQLLPTHHLSCFSIFICMQLYCIKYHMMIYDHSLSPTAEKIFSPKTSNFSGKYQFIYLKKDPENDAICSIVCSHLQNFIGFGEEFHLKKK